MNHLIIAPVVLPAVLAGLIVLLAQNDLWVQRVVSVVGTLILAMIAGVLLVQASTGGAQGYFLGNWPAPFGIVLMLDRLSALMLGLTAFLSVAVVIYVIGTGWDARGKHFHALFLFQLMGLNGAFLTGDAFNLFVFFEVLLIASYGLMIHGGGKERLRAGVQYVAYNLIGSTLFLFGLATIYSVTGTLNMADLAVRVAQLPAQSEALVRVAAVLLMLVFAIKGALAPMQFWLPGAYAAAPGPVAALFAVMTKVGAYALIRFGTMIFPPTTLGGLIAQLLWPAAMVTIALGAFGVLGARELARMVAFAAIGSMGVLFLVVSAFTPAGIAAALYYLVHSTLATAALFLLADLVRDRWGHSNLAQASVPLAQGGLIAGLFMFSAVAMVGMPPLSGFVGKLFVLDALRGQMVWAWTAILVASLLTLIGFGRAGSALFWKPYGGGQGPEAHPAEPWSFFALGLLSAALVALTLFAGPVYGWLNETAAALLVPVDYIAATKLQGGE
ncbi:MAG: monovalent cation/H+ antiporter subunit D [Cypionkella sp.]